jgi:hypothetical protein
MASTPLPPPGRETHRALAIASRWVFAHRIAPGVSVANPGDVSPSWSAQRNVAESEQYDRLLKGNPAFRQARMRKECGPITDPQLHQQCVDSFARY